MKKWEWFRENYGSCGYGSCKEKGVHFGYVYPWFDLDKHNGTPVFTMVCDTHKRYLLKDEDGEVIQKK